MSGIGDLLVLYTGKKWQQNLLYENILSLVYYEMLRNDCVRERVRNCYDLHQVEIHLQRTVLFRASFSRLVPGRLSTQGRLALFMWASAQNGVTSNIILTLLTTDWQLTASSWKLPLLYIFRTPTYSSCSIHEAYPLSLVYFKTQMYILF